ncbi:DUF2512 family protein [Fictibacillus enclensis]|uniref:DUF2512 family protein n=1 Tax=Fictibacillus enclensis TaxID=1017270 RepID=UPI0024BFCD99|nr:DUF2512 family protein [Fictibacillus enclensis]WHY72955.1 DUF2512 family protein [Fictibacillus enclensis]
MDHVKALILKFVMVEVMVYIVLGAAMKVSIGDTFLISLILTIVAYILGDLEIQWPLSVTLCSRFLRSGWWCRDH